MNHPFPTGVTYLTPKQFYNAIPMCRTAYYNEVDAGRIIVNYSFGPPRIHVDDACDYLQRMSDRHLEPVCDPEKARRIRDTIRGRRKREREAAKARAAKSDSTPDAKKVSRKKAQTQPNEALS